MAALRCSPCGISWPFDRKLYDSCPLCLGKTDNISDAPMDEDIALSVKKHADFDRYCIERDEKKAQAA